MARKKYGSSYSEKLIYDNTVFRGIMATTDANAEGYFKQLINLDISDTGQSVTPRKGLINGCLYKKKTNTVTVQNLNWTGPDWADSSVPTISTDEIDHNYYEPVIITYDKCVYFRDNNTGLYFIVHIDPEVNYPSNIKVYKLDLANQLYDKYLIVTEDVTNVFSSEEYDGQIYLNDYITNTCYLSIYGDEHQAQFVKNTSVGAGTLYKYIIKVQSTQELVKKQFWLEMQYNSTTNEMLFTVTNTDDIKGMLQSDRNIASTQPLVPETKVVLYETEQAAHNAGVTYNQFPIIYTYDNEEEVYYINTIPKSSLINLKLLPRYYLLPCSTNERYAYTYEFYNTSEYAEETKKEFGLYDLNTNVPLIKSLYNTFYYEYIDSLNVAPDSHNNIIIDFQDFNDEFNKYGPWLSKTVLVVAVPKITNTTLTLYDSTNTSLTISSGDDTYQDVSEYNTSDNFLSYVAKSIIRSNDYGYSVYKELERLVGSLRLPSFIECLNKSSIFNMFDYYILDANLYSNIKTTNNALYVTKNKPVSIDVLREQVNNYTDIIFKVMLTASKIDVTNSASGALYVEDNQTTISNVFPEYYKGKDNNISDDEIVNSYYIYTTIRNLSGLSGCIEVENYTGNIQAYIKYRLLSNNTPRVYKSHEMVATYENLADVLCVPYVYYFDTPSTTNILTNTSGALSLDFGSFMSTSVYDNMNSKGYFDNGINFVLYLKKIPNKTEYTAAELKTYERSFFVASTALFKSINVTYSNDVSTIPLQDSEGNATNIANSTNWCVFNSTEGYRLVTWINNIVYMSEANDYNYFKQDNKKTYAEHVVKVLPFKDMLLVFTTQNMYSIYPYEDTRNVENGKDDNGNTKYVQEKFITYNTLPVLYNISASEKYADVIKVYNNMILYYAPEGQLYLITPSATIDSDTVFTVKYINQSVNDILANYDTYINDRFEYYVRRYAYNETYNKSSESLVFQANITKDDIIVTSSVSLTYLRIFYTIPKYGYTYILNYDITNNRYTVYDSFIFGDVHNVLHIGSTDFIVSNIKYNNTFSFVRYYKEPVVLMSSDNCDYYTTDCYTYNTRNIDTEINTGIIYLNNQWKKRFKNFMTTYKNIDAKDITFELEIFIDGVEVPMSMSDRVTIKDLYNVMYTEVVEGSVNLLDENTALFDFSKFNSNKYITHVTNIIALGKRLEIHLRLNSTGLYKLQEFAIIYKEHSAHDITTL